MAIRREGGLHEEELTHSVIGAFFAVHRRLGFGFVEQIYLSALERELERRGHTVVREISVPVFDLGDLLAYQRLDMVVDDKLIVEAKATEKIHRRAAEQLYSYLRGTRFEVGLLLHFGRAPDFYRLFYPNSRKQLPGSAG